MNFLKYYKTVGFKENSSDVEVKYSLNPPEREKKGSMTIPLYSVLPDTFNTIKDENGDIQVFEVDTGITCWFDSDYDACLVGENGSCDLYTATSMYQLEKQLAEESQEQQLEQQM